jgi:hypothetical protein
MELKEMVWEVVDRILLAQDRDPWRVFNIRAP